MKTKAALISGLILCNGILFAQKKDTTKAGGVKELAPVGLYKSSINDDARKDYELGYRASEKGDLRKAVSYYRKAIHLDSTYVDALDNCGVCYRQLGILDSAMLCYKASIRTMPTGKLAHMNLAVVYSMIEKYDEAFDEYAKYVDLDPEDPEGHYGEARIYLIKNQPDKALPEAEKAMKLYQKQNPDLVGDAEVYVGLSYYQKGDKSKAKKYLKEAQQHGGKVPPKVLDDLGMN
jgi:tetratricopeptide (TPR) repeat protein